MNLPFSNDESNASLIRDSVHNDVLCNNSHMQMDLGRYSVAKHHSELIYVRPRYVSTPQFIRIVQHAVFGYDTRPHARNSIY